MLKAVMLIAALAAAVPATASTVNSALSGASLRGEATYRYLGLPIYQARLYTKSGQALDWNKDFGLELSYLRNLSGKDIVESTMRELERTGGGLPVRAKLDACFTDVSKGDRYLAVTDGPNRVGFWLNGRKACTLSHPQIAPRFMAIFLGDNTRSKSFTRKLRGQ